MGAGDGDDRDARRRRARGRAEAATAVVPFLAPSAAAFLLAFFFTFDDYYAPELRRYSDSRSATLPIVALAVGAVAVGGIAWRWRRLGVVLTCLALVVVLLASLVISDGH